MAGSYIYGDKSKMFSQDEDGNQKVSYVNANTRVNPVSEITLLDIPTPYATNDVTHPSVVYFGDAWNGYKFWMAFTPYANTGEENPCIVTSNDGIKWEVPSGLTNPVEPPPATGYHSDTELIYDAVTDKLRMYWRTYVPSGNAILYHRETSDGITWTSKVTSTFTNYLDPLSPTVQKIASNKWRLWIGGAGNIHTAESTNGYTWGEFTECQSNVNNHLSFWHPEIRSNGSQFECIVAGFRVNVPTSLSTDLYYGTSQDGIHWTFDVEPIISRNGDYSRRVYRSSLVTAEGKSFIYTSGRSWENKERIGLVEIKQNQQQTIFAGHSLSDKTALPTRRQDSYITQNVTSQAIAAGATAVVNTLFGAHDVDEYSWLVTNTVAHSFSIRLLEYVADGDSEAWVDQSVASTSRKAVIDRQKIKFGHRLSFRVTNNSASEQIYNGYLQIWNR